MTTLTEVKAAGAGNGLHLFNSLGREKVRFTPLDPRGRDVTWYCCGPTVYDAGHLGHARNYVTTDILRRIMRDYFGYNVKFVMNITDVDDKVDNQAPSTPKRMGVAAMELTDYQIILRARQQHLLKLYIRDHPRINDEVLELCAAAFGDFATKRLPLLAADTTPGKYDSAVEGPYGAVLSGAATIRGTGSPGDDEAKLRMHHSSLVAASGAIQAAKRDQASVAVSEFFADTSDILLPFLDARQSASIKSDDYAIFSALTQHWERKFKEDLRLLNCLPPTRLTRVSEFINEIVRFVEEIERKGFAYRTTDGSVYFNIKAFEEAGNQYARLEPWNRNDKDLQADGEGSLTKKNTEKHNDADFALWKASKPGEPSWESPWGQGRPGWHIECSAMASEVLGGRIDIHSGGIDLAFPHHDNELAQSEAFWTKSSKGSPCGHSHDWINYFLHMGHLSIQGSKMSKSLKNFTTIDDALQRKGGWTARGLRIVFLLGAWRQGLEVTDDVVARAGSWEKTINQFFINASAVLREEAAKEDTGRQIPALYGQIERDLDRALDDARTNVDEALRDSFNTPAAMATMEDLVSKANIYLNARKSLPENTYEGLGEVARWITRMVTIFGLDASRSAGGSTIGWSTAESSDQAGGIIAAGDVEPFVREVSTYRDRVRQEAMATTPSKAKLLEHSDRLRDEGFANVGVQLDDRDPQPALIKFVPKAELRAAVEQKKAEAAETERRRTNARQQREVADRAKNERARVSPLEMFRTPEYSEWDDEGMPIKDAEGVELTKSRTKKLRKDWERQKNLHETWLKAGSA
ncbi:MAG: hypothetical protein M1817_005158 [Caeruleum heppii]|nr:MAG: hypothetical protein M1817_005158 [Caeruleum heppii]